MLGFSRDQRSAQGKGCLVPMVILDNTIMNGKFDFMQTETKYRVATHRLRRAGA